MGADGKKIFDEYHKWYYRSRVWEYTTWLGVKVNKSVLDLWNYQEILTKLNPSVIIELGTYKGGSTLFFSTVLKELKKPFKIITIDINKENIDQKVFSDPNIKVIISDSTDTSIVKQILSVRDQFAGPMFVIVDSDHSANHVYKEMVMLRRILKKGDWVIIEDGNINGHPILPNWGDGPWEAMERYFNEYPNDYQRDKAREEKFGFTFAPGGFLVWNNEPLNNKGK
ncbi:MAG: CmcI family methyltransferase [bacterium]